MIVFRASFLAIVCSFLFVFGDHLGMVHIQPTKMVVTWGYGFLELVLPHGCINLVIYPKNLCSIPLLSH